MVTVATNPADAADCVRLASDEPGIWASAGLHPHEAAAFSASALTEIASLLDHEAVVAVGETGLDFYYENAPREVQTEAFRAQAELAASHGLPLIVHSREADTETAAVIDDFKGRVTGVLHCFTGGRELLEVGLAADWHVSFSGIVTFAKELEEIVRRVPVERLLIETDSPYLAPAPKRGKRNEPSFLPHTCRRVAELRGSTAEEVAALTRRNARRFYGLPETPDIR
jgi:TatD DNase family protein